MTYQPERDGYGVVHPRTDDGPTTATADDRPVVINDDGTTTTVDHMQAEDARREAEMAHLTRDEPIMVDPGRHARTIDAEDAHTVVTDDPRAVRGRRVDTVVTPSAAAVVARERAAYGGVKWGLPLFGWLTAMGLAVVLTALLAAAGTALGLANDVTSTEAVNDAVSGNASTIGIVGAIAVLLVMLVSYFAGGYVARADGPPRRRATGDSPCGCGRSRSRRCWASWRSWSATSTTCSGSSTRSRACRSTPPPSARWASSRSCSP